MKPSAKPSLGALRQPAKAVTQACAVSYQVTGDMVRLPLLTAESATDAKKLMAQNKANAALLDYMLPDGNGVELGVEFLQMSPNMLVIVMTGTILPPEEEALCEEHNFPVLRKPFLASDVMNQIRTRLMPVSGAVRA